MSRARRLTAALALTGALFALPACASSVDPIERLGRKAAEKVSPRPHRDRAARPPAAGPSAPSAPPASATPSDPSPPAARPGSRPASSLVRNHELRPGVPPESGEVSAVVRATGS
ncbi:hypothetical protein [Streptomyces sp. NPDC053431]|uniref:hypothetical protein n=1 Tax=Streptomyces sp. NPDC053431 TaxID=3365703 RepID=UPI0037D23FAE